MSAVIALTASAGVMAAIFHHTVGPAPILAALLCAACFLRKREVLIVGLGAMLIHDAIVGLSIFTLVRMVAILGVVGVIWMLRVRPTWTSLLSGVAVASPTYHVALAVGDWVTQFCAKAPHTLPGLAATLMSAFPYFQRSFVSEVLFTAAFLGLYALSGGAIRRLRPALLSVQR